ncbi:MAG: hypothetical protein K6F64_02685 [Clostridia bacterium]|nr:hypothetical protein [Clostridia bacterium]
MKKVLSIIFAVIFVFFAFQMSAFALGSIDFTVKEPQTGMKCYPVEYSVDNKPNGYVLWVVYGKRKSGTDDSYVTTKENEKVQDGYDYCVDITFIPSIGAVIKPTDVKVNGHKATKIELKDSDNYEFRYEFNNSEETPNPLSFLERIAEHFKSFFTMISELFSSFLNFSV